MNPTNKLRFVERINPMYTHSDGSVVGNKIRILQQWWETVPMGTVNLGWTGDIPLGEVKGEWRDIQIEEEK